MCDHIQCLCAWRPILAPTERRRSFFFSHLEFADISYAVAAKIARQCIEQNNQGMLHAVQLTRIEW